MSTLDTMRALYTPMREDMEMARTRGRQRGWLRREGDRWWQTCADGEEGGLSKTKTLYMETTAIPPDKTAAEISSLLVSAGARQISMMYDPSGKMDGMQFVLVVNHITASFKLPVRVDPVFSLLNGRRPKESWKRGNRQEWAEKDRTQAERVAWRQLLRWIQAQLALIETGMVASHEVFLPYMQDMTGRTVFEAITESRFKALPSGKAG